MVGNARGYHESAAIFWHEHFWNNKQNGEQLVASVLIGFSFWSPKMFGINLLC